MVGVERTGFTLSRPKTMQHVTMAFKTITSGMNSAIHERQKTNEVSPVIASAYCLESFQAVVQGMGTKATTGRFTTGN